MAKLAINGGKAISKGVRITWPAVAADDVAAATRVAKSGQWWRYGGHEVENFEKEFGKFHDAKYVLAIANGTVAIEAALRACGIEAGDEVIVPSVTFIASASAVLLVQGIPIFADILEDTCQIDPADAERKITPRTKAILVVHYAGYPVDMDAIRRIAKAHDLWVIEDSAHAQGTEWKGRKVGAIGNIGTFSFQQSKSLTCGEGGAVVTDSEDLYNKAYAYHHIGRALGAARYEHTSVGPNYRITEFQGAILRTQLKKLPRQNETRAKNHKALAKALADIPGIRMLKEDKRVTKRGYYFCVLRFDENEFGASRDAFMAAMNAEGTALLPGYGKPVYQLPAFRDMSFGRKGCPLTCGHYRGKMDYSKVHCPVAEEVSARRHITIGNDTLLSTEAIDLIADAAHKVYENRAELRSFRRK